MCKFFLFYFGVFVFLLSPFLYVNFFLMPTLFALSSWLPHALPRYFIAEVYHMVFHENKQNFGWQVSQTALSIVYWNGSSFHDMCL
jgi:hypothetical protein